MSKRTTYPNIDLQRTGQKMKHQRPHFDIAQKSMIVWNDEEELINRLKRRIEATVK